MTFSAEEVREKAHGYSLRGDDRTAAMLNAYADTLSKPADSGRVGDETATVASMRAELVAKIGDCCMGGDPLCAGGCLAEKAAARNAEREAALAAQGQREPDPMEAIVQHCMVTEAVSPDSADPYGTISRVIDWHQANTAPPAVVPEGYVLVPREPTLDMQAAHQIHGDTSDWWNAVIEAAAPPQPEE